MAATTKTTLREGTAEAGSATASASPSMNPRDVLDALELPSRMTPSDALFWYAESALPSFRATIAGLYILDGPPQPEGMATAVDTMISAVPRLKQRVIETPLHLGLPEWIDDVHFDETYHLRHVSLASPGTIRDLLDFVGTVFATPFDHERPLWEAYWIDGLEGNKTALLLKLHHSMVDGVGAIAILNALTYAVDDHGPPVVRRLSRNRWPRMTGPLAQWMSLAIDGVGRVGHVTRWAASMAAGVVTEPISTFSGAMSTLRGLGGAITDLSSPALADPLITSTSGLSRRLDVLNLSIDRLRRIKAPFGVTLNDLVLAALAGAVGAYHRERGVRCDNLNCMVPTNLRSRDERDQLGNRVGALNIVLPVGELDPELRLRNIVAQTKQAKSDHRSALYPFVMEAISVVPVVAFRWVAKQSLGRVNIACTNVPGIGEPRRMAGAMVEAIYPFASVVEGTPLVVAMLSYAECMDIGIDTDPEAIPDPHRIAELLETELAIYERISDTARLGSRSSP